MFSTLFSMLWWVLSHVYPAAERLCNAFCILKKRASLHDYVYINAFIYFKMLCFRYKVDLAGENWKLSLSDAKSKDSGVYLCHVSTHPPMLRVFRLQVHGKLGLYIFLLKLKQRYLTIFLGLINYRKK